MMQLRLVLAIFLLAVGSLDLANGTASPALAITGLVVAVALLVSVVLDMVWRGADAQTAP